MAEAVVGSTIEVLLKQLIAVAGEEIRLIRKFSKDLQQLKESAAMIRDFLEDAETKVMTNKSVKRWLMNLESVAFDADYVFDEITYHALRKKAKRGTKPKKMVRCFFPNSKSLSFRHKMARKINDIKDKLKSINEEATQSLHLLKGTGTSSARGNSLHLDLGRETDSVTEDRVFVGREYDATKIVEMVKNSPTEKVLSVIPIVGMGGLGKTTLAKKVFKDDNIISCFENRIWVYVSENFVQETVFQRIFESLTGAKVDGSREVVLRRLREQIGEKRYILVLDDVWTEDRLIWDNFIKSLESISRVKGNVVLITTRKGNVASIVKTKYTYELGVLSEEDCWCIIKAKCFEGERIPSDCELRGKKIAERCGGLPLAAEVVGSLLRGKSENEWCSIEKKLPLEFGEDAYNVTKIIKLSFDNLPSASSKKCFAFCSIIPKGWYTEKEEFIQLWMAEGLVQARKGEDMQIEGDRVFNVLLQSSLLQVYESDGDGDLLNFEMHDLVHDLASSILRSKFLEDSHQVRYISRSYIDESSPISEEHAKCLRALFFTGKIPHNIFSNLTRLHVLYLNDDEMKILPMEIGKLICLRFLDISHTKIECLPDSIGDLYHLQTLRATTEYGGEGCLQKLPHTFKFLINLRHLYIPNIELPQYIGKLSSLQTLAYFKVSDVEEGSGINELGSLNNLKGGIEIHNLEKVRDKEEAKMAKLIHKVNITKLKLMWNDSRTDDQNSDESVLDGLQPHRHLESLKIEGFKGTNFPSWTSRMEVRVDVEDRWRRFDNLLAIKLLNCRECEEVPTMGHLPQLKSLHLSGLSKVQCLGSSFYGVNEDTNIVVFPALETLQLIDMENLRAWTEVESSRNQSREVLPVFPRLEYLKIKGCKELKSAPSHFPSLKELEIDDMESGLPLASICGSKLTTLTKLRLRKVDGMECLPEGLLSSNRDLRELEILNCNNVSYLVPCLGGGGASLKKLVIYKCMNLEKLPEDLYNLNALEELEIFNCPNLKSIAYPSGRQGFISLRHLQLLNCTGLAIFPCEILELCALSLQSLWLAGSESLTNLPQVMSFLHKMPHLTRLSIERVPKLSDVVLEIGSLGSIKRLDIGGCGDFVSFKESLDRILPAFSSLESLELNGLAEWDALPDQLQSLTTIRDLYIQEFGIEVLPEWLGRLSSLRKLYLEDCKKLRHLPSKKSMQDLARLNYLDIRRCPLLKQNLEQDRSDGSEWSKISHIHNFRADGDG